MIDEAIIVKKVSDQSGMPETSVSGKSMLRQDCNLTPMEIVDLLTDLSHQYKIELGEDLDIDNIVTIADLHDFLNDQSAEL